MTKILTIVGARPQFIKAAMVSRAILEHNRTGSGPAVEEIIIHTGQHYDANMSDIFFNQMEIPKPTVMLDFGALSHGAMTGRMLEAVEKEILDRSPDWVLVYGDTNSTLAGALSAAKLQVPVAHVEAGLRSFNKAMPEEINRILTDHTSNRLFCPTETAVRNLANEGIIKGVHQVGDVMYDAVLQFGAMAEEASTILEELKLTPKGYLLATVHRQENTDERERLESIFSAFIDIATDTHPLIIPLHPRTRNYVKQYGMEPMLLQNPNLLITDPLGFLDMIFLEKHASAILTDSGGVQKEAYFHGVPCITLRNETEWLETIDAGWNQLVGANKDAIIGAMFLAMAGEPIHEYGNGTASKEILLSLLE